MEFVLNAGEKPFKAYGYSFEVGIPVDVEEENLINKFQMYHQFNTPAPKKRGRPKAIKDDESENDQE